MKRLFVWFAAVITLAAGVNTVPTPTGAGASAASSAAGNSGSLALPDTGALWGAYLAPDQHNGLDHNTAWTNFEALVGRSMDVERVYYNWNQSWPTAEDEWSRDQGHTLYISWSANADSGVCTPWKDIADGLHDTEIDARAAGLVAFGAPVIFSFHHEPTNKPPAGGTCGTGAEFQAAWRHIKDRFVADGATQVSYALTLFALSYTNFRGDEFYAGDNYVDIIAADGYNWHGCQFHPGPWRTFQQVFQDFYNYGISKGKPMFAAEYGTGEDDQDPNGKAQWFTDAADQLKKWPEIKGVAYFNVGGGYPCTRYVDSSQASLDSFKAMGADPYFNSPVATTSVAVADFSYTPSSLKVNQGTGVIWGFDGPSQHTVTDRTGLALFDTGPRSPGATFSWYFLGAGSYTYRCSLHPAVMIGTVKVPVVTSPRMGNQSTVFTIKWAADHAPTNFAFDIQIQRPGSTMWTSWLTLQTLASSTFVPDGGVGTYRFRARYRSAINGKAARWSAPVAINVTA